MREPRSQEAARAFEPVCRSEPGCIEYSFSADGLDPGLIRIFEIWESQEALTTHLGVLAGQQGQSSGAPAIAVKKADVLQYAISSSGPLGR